jgi:hypothetical protein
MAKYRHLLSLIFFGFFVEYHTTNTTYLDCPVANFSKENDFTMSIAIHSPSANDLKSAKVAVPKGSYEAMVFDKETKEY